VGAATVGTVHHDHDLLIIGGGMVADSAAKAARESDADASITIIGEEPTAPFPRPALSKKLWTDPEMTVGSVALQTEQETGATLVLGTRVTALDADAKQVTTDDGDTHGYRRALVATGGHPKHIEGLEPSERVLYYRTLTDYQALRALAGGGAEIAVIGGSFIGTEIAAALSAQDCSVTLVHTGHVLADAIFPSPLAEQLEGLFVDAGVRLVPGARVTSGAQQGDRVTLHLSTGATIDVDGVVVGLGIEPATDFLDGVVDLTEDGGVAVDAHLATSRPDLWAAGDVASYPDKILGRTRVEHVDNANEMGAAAGRILTGSDETYDHTPMYYSDLLGHGYEAIGATHTSLETVVDERDGGAVVYYLDDDEVRGVLIWDFVASVDAARELLATHTRPANAADLLGTLR
jgi:NADPH-dependent 2,4-dienoyl-CoA reductase/sulfur reductase-like enzyme